LFYLHDEPQCLRFTLVEALDASELTDLAGSWCTAESTRGTRALVVDIRRLKSLDQSIQALLADLRRAGARILDGAQSAGPNRRFRKLL
jgi:hypothetical protein